jgi:flagellar hook protein FlgE
MIGALNASVQGLRDNMQKIDRIAHNIANVNTEGFKSKPAEAIAPPVDTFEKSSDVDLAHEFTSMIIAKRGFEANARTITASDEMMGEVVNLKRK